MKTREYWEAKHPKIREMYSGRPLPGTNHSYPLDVRHFLTVEDHTLHDTAATLVAPSIDGSVLNCQRWVVKHVKYTADDRFGTPEYWLFPWELRELLTGDCEDGANLMASLALHVLPEEHHWRVRVTAGWVAPGPTAQEGGHAYLTYCRGLDNEWVILDWCFLEDSAVPVDKKPLAKTVTTYHDVWFSFDRFHAYSHKTLGMRGRVRNMQEGWR